MSDQLSAAQARVAAVLGPLDGGRVRGGCEDCDAYQTAKPANRGCWVVSVHHDPDCPVLARKQARQ